MKNIKLLRKLIHKCVADSFDKQGLDAKKVNGYVAVFKKLSDADALVALKDYYKGLQREVDLHTLEIYTAIPLTEDEVTAVKAGLGQDQVIYQTKQLVVPELLGGLRIRIGDMIYDDTLEGRIEQIGQAIRA